MASTLQSEAAGSRYTIVESDEYVHMRRQTGYEVFAHDMSGLMQELKLACRSAGTSKVLISGEEAYVHLNTPEVLELGEMIARLQLRIAIVQDAATLEEDADLLDDFTFNQGARVNHDARVRFFQSESEACCWLADAALR